MNAPSVRNSDYLPELDSKLPEKDQIKFLYKHLTQLWQKCSDQKATIDRLSSLLNSEVSTKRILEMINSRDVEYVTKREFQIYKSTV